MITVKWKKNKVYPTLISNIRVLFAVLWRLYLKGYIQVKVWYSDDFLYEVDSTDQADVLKLAGFKSIKKVSPDGVPYKISISERIIGFRRKNKNDHFIEFGVHERIDGKRLKFEPTVVKVYPETWFTLPLLTGFKWGYLPVGPYFGGHDSNGDGLGGRAPKNLSIKIKFI